MARIGLNRAFGAPTRQAQVTEPNGKIVIKLTRHEFNKVQQGLRALIELTRQRRNALSPEDVRRKSYGYDIYDANELLRKIRDQFNEK